MGKIQTLIPDDLEKEFRLEIGRRCQCEGYKHGAMREAVIEAIHLWLNTQKENERKNPSK